MTRALPRVVHVIRPEPDGSIGGADLHVLELAAAQTELGLCRPVVLAAGHGTDFGHRAECLSVPIGTARQLGRSEIALIHAHGYESDLIGLLLAGTFQLVGRTRPPVVMTCHGIIEPDLRHRVLNLIDRTCLRRADALVAVSTHGVRQLRHIAPDRPVHLIRNGVRAPTPVPSSTTRQMREQLGAGEHDHLVGYVGRLSREKRPDLFLDVAAQVAAMRSTARFALIGGGSLADEVRSTAARSTAATRIVLAGLRHDMDAVFAALDLLIIPSDVENTPRVLHEALSRGVPTVVTAVGDMPLMVRGAAHTAISPPGDTNALAAAAVELLTANPALHRRTIETSRSGGTVDHMSRAVQHVYSAVLPPGSSTWRAGTTCAGAPCDSAC